jgi:hypothetical protein
MYAWMVSLAIVAAYLRFAAVALHETAAMIAASRGLLRRRRHAR